MALTLFEGPLFTSTTLLCIIKYYEYFILLEQCSNYWRLDAMFRGECNSEYSSKTEEQGSFLPGWANITDNITFTSDPWIYHHAEELGTMPIWGKLGVYGGGGYVLEHDHKYSKADKEQRETFAAKWIDRYTRAVVAEFVVYNANANVFAVVSMLFEMTSAGSINKYWDVNTLNLYSYSGSFAIFRICAEFIFCAFLLFNIYHLIRSLMKNKLKHFEGVWNRVDFVLIVGSLITVILYVVRFFLVKKVMKAFTEDKGMEIVRNTCTKVDLSS